MATELRYRKLVLDGWDLRVLPEKWSSELWQCIIANIRRQVARRHPQTVRLNFSGSPEQELFFLKVYHSAGGWGAIKDWCRDSKAFRFLKLGIALSDAGFLVPITIAAGEERHLGILKRSFVVTLGLEGAPLPVFLNESFRADRPIVSVVEKRNSLQSLAQQVRRLHDLGFVHGDLVPSNIFVCRDPAKGLKFYFMDNDRTHRYPTWLPQRLWKRNLVQLNRFILASISLQDRIRFFRAYSAGQNSNRGDRQLLRWLEAKTRQRRRECDSVDTRGSFRKLMSHQKNSANDT